MNKITKIGGTGLTGGIITAIVLELGTQAILKYAPQNIQNKVNQTIFPDAPLLGPVNIRDGAVLSPSILQALNYVRGKKADIGLMIGNYGAKVVMRMTGINPHGLKKLGSKYSPSDTSKSTTETNIIASSLPVIG